MPDSSEDQFAELFGKLPDPRQRSSAAPSPDAARSEGDPSAPSSRRAARLAAQGTGEQHVAPGGQRPATDPRVPQPAVDAPPVAASIPPRPSALPGESAARPGPATQAASLQDLFTGSVTTEAIGQPPPPTDRRRRRRRGWIAFGIVVII
ncbi:MAG: hypothetical protein J0I97_06155, partial [Microbacterium sp.]|nr:hypothetical protein [Microbacterium sp.]